MKCAECQNDVNNDAAVCYVCGYPVERGWGDCRMLNRPRSQLGDENGGHLGLLSTSLLPLAGSTPSARPVPAASAARPHGYGNLSERKLVTVLFSDLSGYSALCKRLDPEDVREMMNLVFREIIGIINRYRGYIDRIIGDEVLAVFGIPRIHEDDPVRAIRAALDIHAAVFGMTDQFKGRLQKPLAMHSGIATGLVVTGKTDLEAGRHGLTGDTVNRASLLTRLATSGEILVGRCTKSSTSGFFFFEKRQYKTGRGMAETIDAYRVLRTIKEPDKIRRVQGLRARLIGRNEQMESLHRHLSAVAQGSGACVFLEGGAGTGKSRLISEFKKASIRCDAQWLQGNAYAYRQGVPYFPLIDLLGRAVDLRDEDPSQVVRQKLADGLHNLSGEDGTIAQIIARLFTMSYEKVQYLTPESWKIKLRQALARMIINQSRTGLTVICIEDLHWADPSTVDLFRLVLNEADLPVLFLISYRPGQLNFHPHQITNPYFQSHCIQLNNLSPEKGEEMVKSLLQSDQVPSALLTFISDQLGGNPFFLEEVVNTLVDTGSLTKIGTTWELSGPIGETAFSSSITALIAARLDRLGGAAKRIVQEASVLGRRFSPAILRQIASDPEAVDHSLATLESLGLILQSDDPGGNQYQFKHALVQDVAYNGLLKQERRNLHEKIARVLESQRPDRIEALCETLAFHFSNGHSLGKAVDYLRQSGRKGVKKYAVIESHDYYEKAYLILMGRERADDSTLRLTLELLLEWFYVYHLRGLYRDVLTLLKQHESAAMVSNDLHLKAMYLICLGCACQKRGHLNRSRRHLLEAFDLGEQLKDYKVIAHACAHLIWTCTDMGRFDEALTFAAKSEEASRIFESEDPSWSFEMDQELVRFILTGTAIAHMFRGDCRQCYKQGDRLLAYGKKAGDLNSISEGYLTHGMGSFVAGDFPSAIEKCSLAIDRSVNPFFTCNARFNMAYAYLSVGAYAQAEKHFNAIIGFCQSSGYEFIGTTAEALSCVVTVAKGDISAGVTALNRHALKFMAQGKNYHAQTSHYLLGRIFLNLVLRKRDMGFLTLVRNLPFFLRQFPRAAKHAEHHFKTAIRIAGQINALGIKGQASLDLGRLYQAQKRNHLAAPLIKESVALFEQLGADGHLKRALATLNTLEQ